MCVTHTLPTSSPLSVPVVVSQAFLTLCLSFQATLQYSTLLKSVFCCIISLQKPKPFHNFPFAYSIKSSSSVGLLLIRSLPVFPTSFLAFPGMSPLLQQPCLFTVPEATAYFHLCSGGAPESVGISPQEGIPLCNLR